MSGRIFVVIFFFWALLIIITPTLVQLSETSKPSLDSDARKNEERKSEKLKARRILDEYTEQYPPTRKVITLPPTTAPAPVPVPVPTEDITPGTRKAFLVKLLSESRRLLISKTKHMLVTAS